MKCENCGKNIANVHYRANYNGNVTEKHLCSECAEKMGYDRDIFGGDMFSDFMGSFLGRDFFTGFGRLGGFGMMPFMIPTMMLPRLEIRYGEEDEETAKEAKTEEKAPETAETDPELSRRRELNELRSKLEAAVKEERFEDAIELRDKIRELEK